MVTKVSVAGVFSSPKRAHVQSMCCLSSACSSWFYWRIHQCLCIKYNDFHNCAQKHVNSAWHRQSQEDTTRFLNTVLHPERRVDSLLDNAFNATVSSNRAKLEPILSSIIFCGTHDIALRGKDSKFGNLNDLLDFRIEAGDAILKEHIEKASGNA